MLARDTQELLDHLKWDSVHIVGLSMGGMIAQELSLLLSPQRIASLTLGTPQPRTPLFFLFLFS
jgi:pimeloyl-ACP methyl ester carboxylesterase